MERLLNINIIPAKTELNIQKSQLSYNTPQPSVEMSIQKGGLEINTEKLQIHIDSFEMQQSIGLKSVKTLVNEYGAEGKQAAYQATANFVQEGNQMATPNGMKVHDIVAQRANKSIETVLEFLPKERPKISWEGGKTTIDYTPDKLNINFNIGKISNYNFQQGKVDMNLIQKPAVEIEYLGQPRYVQSSWSPDGQKLNTKV